MKGIENTRVNMLNKKPGYQKNQGFLYFSEKQKRSCPEQIITSFYNSY
jgi:hypothetical protein